MSERDPNQPDQPNQPEQGPAFKPEEPSSREKDERPLKSIYDLEGGSEKRREPTAETAQERELREQAAARAREKAAEREAEEQRRASSSGTRFSKFDPHTGKRRPKVLTEDEPEENRLRSQEGPIAAVGWMGWKIPLAVGVTAFVIAAVLAGTNAARGEMWRDVGRVLLFCPIDALLGMAALLLLTRLAERPLGNWPSAAARMFAAVALFFVVMQIGGVEGFFAQVGLLALGALAYGGVLWGTLRIGFKELLALAAGHLILWGAAHLVFWLIPRVAPAQTEPPPPPPPPAETAPATTDDTINELQRRGDRLRRPLGGD